MGRENIAVLLMYNIHKSYQSITKFVTNLAILFMEKVTITITATRLLDQLQAERTQNAC